MLIYLMISVVAAYFLFAGLVAAKPFLAPLVTAMVLSLLMLPVARAFEKWGLDRVWATLWSTLILLAAVVVFVAVMFSQIRGLTDDWDELSGRLSETLEQVTLYLDKKTPLTHEQLSGIGFGPGGGREGQGQGNGWPAVDFVRSVLGFLTELLIVLVYVFLFIHFRSRFKEFLLKFFASEKRKSISGIINRSSAVSRHYLAGKLLLMVFLAILYYTGLRLTGLENALLISLLSAALSIIPVVGNLIGYLIAISVSLLTGGGMAAVLGISITFAMAQIIDTYILQPIVLGPKVDVHPVFIILSVVLGYHLWGIIGLVLAIPVFGMIAVLCRTVPVLSPFGFLFSKNGPDKS